MPTINQLVRHGRRAKIGKIKAPAMRKNWNSLRQRQVAIPGAPQKRGVCLQVRTVGRLDIADLGHVHRDSFAPSQRHRDAAATRARASVFSV